MFAKRTLVLRIVRNALLASALAGSAACHPGPVLKTGEVQVGGTIAGIVAATGGGVALGGRKVTATNVATRATFDATTNVTGGFTIKVPEGTYHLEVEVRSGEAIAKRPDDTHVNNGDLDPGRDFEITAAAGR